MRSKWDWLGALTGVAAVAVGFVAVLIGGEPESADKGADAVVKWYADNKDQVELTAIFGVLAGELLIFFFAYLGRVLREAPGSTGVLSMLPVIGAAILTTGLAIDSTLAFAAAEAVDDNVDKNAVLAIQAIWDNDFIPFVLGAFVIVWSAGLSIVRHGGLPKWLGWILLALGLIMATPIGFIGLLALLVWVVGVSIYLALRARSSAALGSPDTTPEGWPAA